jgi:hypothetical protein
LFDEIVVELYQYFTSSHDHMLSHMATSRTSQRATQTTERAMTRRRSLKMGSPSTTTIGPKTPSAADPIGPAALLELRRSDGSDVLGFVALAAWTNVEFDLLALIERLVALACDIGVVDEHVLPAVT